MNRNYCVYCHTNKTNGKKYIGLTCEKRPERRWRNGKGYSYNDYFKNSIDLYGWDGFNHEIIKDNLTESEAKLLEKELIAKYNTTDRNFGYNLTEGGEGICGYRHTPETRAKMSEERKGEKNSFYGRHHTKETKKINSERHKRENLSEETLKKMSESHKGIFDGENNPMYGMRGELSPWWGKHHREETKKKISESRMGGKHPLAVPVLQLDLDTGEVLNKFDCIADACRATGATTITRVAQGKQKSSGGFGWKYA